jgi:hypothetical protein
MGRKYTGWDANATGKRAGLEKFVELTVKHFNGGVWNNGTWNVRNMNTPGAPKPSVHGTGRAADLSWRANKGRGFGNYQTACQVVDFWVANAELFLIEEIHDYHLAPFGRGWRCDRSAWRVYTKNTIGSPGGDWFHVEIAPTHADNPAYYEQAFASLGGAPAPAAAPAPAPAAGLKFEYPGTPIKLGSKGDAVKLVQAVVGEPVIDGDFGRKTDAVVRLWQAKQGLKSDGVVGPATWAKMFG